MKANFAHISCITECATQFFTISVHDWRLRVSLNKNIHKKTWLEIEMRHAGCIYLHQFAKIKFGSFQNLDFTNENILQWVDAGSGLFNLSANHLRNEFLHQLLQITGWSLVYHNFSHLAANLTWDKHKNQTKIIIYNLKNNQHKNRG